MIDEADPLVKVMVEVYHKAKRYYEFGRKELEKINEEIEKANEELHNLKLKFIVKYGSGYLTVKKVRKYKYIIWRTYEGKDVYINSDDDLKKAQRILELRSLLAKLYRRRARLKRLLARTWSFMKMAEGYL